MFEGEALQVGVHTRRMLCWPHPGTRRLTILPLPYPQTPLSTHSQWVAKATLIPEVSVGTCGFHLQPKQVNVHMFDAADVRIFAFR